MGGGALRATVGRGDAGGARHGGGGNGGKDQALRDTRHGEVLLGIETTAVRGARLWNQRAAQARVVPPKE
ncbi:hypothetical protein GCM10017557_53990 [Streptomyces aurantiacus]|uniref:Uncharacterized protein n=1 Tax=Streptomyces aurantiacus TaxID=47760 RepID=A0A7G1P9S7_9ACTN|nr:hypothetical protein GCM10017557_53990 [Streptomyces aurantiacus]